MGENPCPVCETTEYPKYDSTSDWCVFCVEGTLLDQAAEQASDSKVTHEVI